MSVRLSVVFLLLLVFGQGATPVTMTCCHAGGVPLTNPQTVHLIPYGSTPDTVANAAAKNLITTFSSSANALIPQLYNYPATGAAVTGNLTFGVQDNVVTNPAYGSSSTINVSAIPTMITDEIAAGHLPALASGNTIYVVMVGPGILINGIAGDVCGRHVSATINTFVVTIIEINDQTQTSGCGVGSTVSGTAFATDDCNVIYHELMESLTVGWSGATGEIADACDFTFGATQTHLGQNYNFLINGTYYLLQMIWVQFQFPDPSAGACQQGLIYPQRTNAANLPASR